MSGLRLSASLTLPLDTVTMTQVTLGRKGSGKTNTAVVAAEEMLRAGQRVVVLDPVGVWWGLKSNKAGDGPGFAVPILGGDHGDVQLEPTAGEVIARAVVEQNFSCVVDIGLFSKGQMLRFSADFLETLYRLNRDSMHLIVDEADAFAPQRTFGEDARTLGAMQSVVRRGRARGIGITMITQRPQVLNKDVLTQADILCALRLSHPKDISAVKEWVDVHAEPKEAKEMVDSLPDLPTGTAWFWAPTMKLFQRVKVRARETFDSSATPKPGERRMEPQNLAKIDVQTLGEKIAATVQHQQANAPDALKRRIAELEKQVASRPQSNPEKEQMPVEQIQQMEEELGQLRGLQLRVEERAREFAGELRRIVAGLEALVTAGDPAPSTPRVQRQELSSVHTPQVARARFDSGNGTGLDGPSMRILDALASLEAVGISPAPREQVAVFSGYSNLSSKGFANSIGTLRTSGYIDYPAPGTVVLTQTGRAAAPQKARPATNAEFHQKLFEMLGGPETRILKPLISYYPRAMEREHVAAQAGYGNLSSKGFANSIGRLRSLGLIDYPQRGMVQATGLLFLNGGR